MFGVEDVVLLSVIILVIFGPEKLPDLAKVLGKASKEFRKIAYTAQRTWDEISKETELKEASELMAAQLATKQSAQPPAAAEPAAVVEEAGGAPIAQPAGTAAAPGNGAPRVPTGYPQERVGRGNQAGVCQGEAPGPEADRSSGGEQG